MEKVNVTIYRGEDGQFWCRTEEDVYGSGLNGAGVSVKDAKADLLACLNDAKVDYEESGNVAYDVEFCYQYDLQSFFNYFSFLNVTEIARRADINPSLMRQYASGVKSAGEKTYSKLAGCIEGLAKELQVASFG